MLTKFEKLNNLVYFSDRKNLVDSTWLRDELKAIENDEAIQTYLLELFESGNVYGNSVSSSVAYVIGVTDVAPSRYPDGLTVVHGANNPPDCDLDWPQGDRERMIEYTREKYSPEFVSHIATFGTMKSRTAVKDAARVLGFDYALGDRISKSLPPLIYGADTPLSACLVEHPKFVDGFVAAEGFRSLYDSDPDVKQVVDVALMLEGQVRQSGMHAAGVLIGDRPLSELVPLERRVGGPLFTQWDKYGVESVGLLKMDFLGLINLDIVKSTCDMVGLSTDVIPLDDVDTYGLLSAGDTVGVFQLESPQIRSLARRMQPDSIKDVAAILALYRPGPISQGWHNDYVERKHGRQPVEYFHEDAVPILKDAYGIIYFQEHVMSITRVFAGYSLAEADLFRRAIGKKDASLMESLREGFISGCVDNGYSEEFSSDLFSKLEGFASYCFSSCHSFPYSIVTYWTAYLKTHYPKQYMASLCTYSMSDLEKCALYIHEAKRMGIEVTTPDVNLSTVDFTVAGETIVMGLAAVKGIGRQAAEAIINERSNGPYTSLIDFVTRTNPNVRVLTALAQAGALDAWGPRLGLASIADDVLTQYRKSRPKVETESLFDSNEYWNVEIPNQEYGETERLKKEKEVLGLYVSGHPLYSFEQSFTDVAIADLKELDADKAKLLVMITDVAYKRTKKGDSMAVLTLEDPTGTFESPVFPKTYTKAKGHFSKGDIGLITVRFGTDLSGDRNFVYMGFDRIVKPQEPTVVGDYMYFYLPRGFAQNASYVSKLKSVLLEHRGNVPVSLFVGKQTKLKLTDDFKVKKSPELVAAVKDLFLAYKK